MKDPIFCERRLWPGEVPYIGGSRDTWIWYPRHGWKHAPNDKELVPFSGFSGRGKLKRWLAERLAKAPELSFKPWVVLLTREVHYGVHDDYIVFGLFVSRPLPSEEPFLSKELGQHLGLSDELPVRQEPVPTRRGNRSGAR